MAPPADPRFVLPDERSATVPPEARGLQRDEVVLLVVRSGDPANGGPARGEARPRILETRFRELPDQLAPGDLVVINVSATLPAAVDGQRRAPERDASDPVTVHVAGPHPDGDGTVIVEVRRPDGTGKLDDVRPGEFVGLGDDVYLELLASYPDARSGRGSRLWHARADGWSATDGYAGGDALTHHLASRGRPITYSYLEGRWPLEDYQTVYGRVPGSAEMASAGRPFTSEVITELIARGIAVAPLVLHTGVSSLEASEAPPAERFEVPAMTARMVELTRKHGGRVVAVGTTVVRALETVAAPDGRLWAGSGWTDLELGPTRPARVVDGLLTGWHAPDASHLRLLDAVAGESLVDAAYGAALEAGLLWHEFGDTCLLLP